MQTDTFPGNARNVAATAIRSERDIAADGSAAAAERAVVAARWARKLVRNNPARTFAVVAAVGVVIGALVWRR